MANESQVIYTLPRSGAKIKKVDSVIEYDEQIKLVEKEIEDFLSDKTSAPIGSGELNIRSEILGLRTILYKLSKQRHKLDLKYKKNMIKLVKHGLKNGLFITSN